MNSTTTKTFVHQIPKANVIKLNESRMNCSHTEPTTDIFEDIQIKLILKRWFTDNGNSLSIYICPLEIPKKYQWFRFSVQLRIPRKPEMESGDWVYDLEPMKYNQSKYPPGSNLPHMALNDAIRFYEINEAYFINEEYLEIQYTVHRFEYELSSEFYILEQRPLLEKILAKIAPEAFETEIEQCRAEVERMKKLVAAAQASRDKISAETELVRSEGAQIREERDLLLEETTELKTLSDKQRQEITSLKMANERLEKKVACFNLAETLVKVDHRMIDLHNYNLPQMKHMSRELQMFLVRITEKIEELETCILCMDNRSNCILSPCGHTYYCIPCVEKIISKEKKCPVCDQAVMKWLQFGREEEDGMSGQTPKPDDEDTKEQVSLNMPQLALTIPQSALNIQPPTLNIQPPTLNIQPPTQTMPAAVAERLISPEDIPNDEIAPITTNYPVTPPLEGNVLLTSNTQTTALPIRQTFIIDDDDADDLPPPLEDIVGSPPRQAIIA